MTEEEAIKLLDEAGRMSDGHMGDMEAVHTDADAIITEFLFRNGYVELATKYQRMSERFWYA